MASSTIFSYASALPRPLFPPFQLPSLLPLASRPSPSVKFPPFRYSSPKSFFSGTSSFTVPPLSPLVSTHQKVSSLFVFSAKGYKMKTHEASAKRFRVTGKGKIMRRNAGKQHFLAKNTEGEEEHREEASAVQNATSGSK